MGKVIRNLEATTRPGRNNALNGAAWTRAMGCRWRTSSAAAAWATCSCWCRTGRPQRAIGSLL
jgi:hypothetical protein